MADLQSFTVVEGTAVTVTAPDTVISVQIYDGDPAVMVADYTGDNAFHFPRDWASLSADQRSTIMGSIAQQIVLMRAGLA